MSGEGAVRAAETLLRANGVVDVMLRVPASAAAGAPGEELGLATPLFQDVPLSAVSFRKAGSETELVVWAKTVESLLGTLEFDSAKKMFVSSAGVVIDGAVYAVTGCVAMRADDAVYAFRLMMRPPQV